MYQQRRFEPQLLILELCDLICPKWWSLYNAMEDDSITPTRPELPSTQVNQGAVQPSCGKFSQGTLKRATSNRWDMWVPKKGLFAFLLDPVFVIGIWQ